MDLEEYGETLKFFVRDRDAKFVAAFDAVFHSVGMRIIKTPVQAPRANAIMERRIGSCRREVLDRTLIWNLSHLRRILAEYEDHLQSASTTSRTASGQPAQGATRAYEPRRVIPN